MSNNWTITFPPLIPGDIARAGDVEQKLSGLDAGFDKLPEPHPTLKGFSEPVAVASATNPEHAVNQQQLDAASTADRSRANHTGTQAPATISPQGPGSGLNADMVDGFETSQSGGANKIVVTNANGNLGIATAPSAWGGGYKGFDVQTGAIYDHSPGTASGTAFNAYFDGAVWRYKGTGGNASAHRHEMGGGGQSWLIAPSGVAGDPIPFIQGMTLTQGGNLLVGTSSSTGERLQLDTVLAGNALSIAAVGQTANRWRMGILSGADLSLSDNTGEKNRTTSGGYFKASNTGVYGGAGLSDLTASPQHVFQTDQTASNIVLISTSAGQSDQLGSYFVTGATGRHYTAYVNGVRVFQVDANGDNRNQNNSYGAISARELKNIIEAFGPEKRAALLAKWPLIQWWIYTLKSDPTDKRLLGVIADELEQLFPSLITYTDNYETVTRERTIEKTVPVTQPEERTETTTYLEEVDGRWFQRTRTTTKLVDVAVADVFPVYGEDGEPVLELVTPARAAKPALFDGDGNEVEPAQPAVEAVYRPRTHSVTRTQVVTEVERYTEQVPTGTRTASVAYSVLDLLNCIVTQELLRITTEQGERIAALEAA